MAESPDLQLKNGELRLFQDLMYREAGIRMADAKHTLVQSRLRQRLDALGLTSYRDYHTLVTAPGNETEFQRCLEALTTNETFFFRHKQHWDCVLDQIVPEWKRKAAKGATFRAWSAASSTGEEPYSLAIALDAALDGTAFTARVEATDINTQVLARAKQGIYGSYALQKLTQQCLARYFRPLPDGERHQVRDTIRQMVEFRSHNLLQPSRGPAFDLILLRNVLIYFDSNSKHIVLGHIANRLKPGAWMILGGAETLSGRTSEFSYVQPATYRKN